MTLTIIYPNDSGIDHSLYTQAIPLFSIHRDFGAGLFPCSAIQAKNARLSSWLLS